MSEIEAKPKESLDKVEKNDQIHPQKDANNNHEEIEESKESTSSIQTAEKKASLDINNKSELASSSVNNIKSSKGGNSSSLGSFMSGMFKKSSSTTSKPSKTNLSDLEQQQKKLSQKQEALEDRLVMLQSAQNRKTNVFEKLRSWDAERLAALNTQRSILESVLGNVDYRARKSQENIQAVSLLLRQVIQHITSAVDAKNSNISMLKIYSQIYSKIEEGALVLEDEKKAKQSFIDVFTARVEKEIFSTIINPECESYALTIAALRQNLIELRKQLAELHNKTAKKSLKLRNLYGINNNITKRSSKDFLKSVYSFLRVAEQLKDRQIIFSDAVMELWNRVLQLEIRRSKALQNAIGHFSALHTQFIVNQNVPTLYSSKVNELLLGQDYSSDNVMKSLMPNKILLTQDKLYLAKLLGKEIKQQQLQGINEQVLKEGKESGEGSQGEEEKKESEGKESVRNEGQSRKGNEQQEEIEKEKNQNNTKIEQQQQQTEKSSEIANQSATSLNKAPQQQSADQTELKNIQVEVDFSMAEVGSAIRETRYPPFDDTGLALKKVSVLREFLKNSFKQSTVIITPDCFLICYDDLENSSTESVVVPAEGDKQDEKGIQNSNTNQSDLSIKVFKRKPDFEMQIKNITFVKNDLQLSIKSNQKISLISLLKPQNACDIFFSSADRLDEFTQVLSALNESTL